MPDYTYTGPERTYPESRDAYSVPVGTVNPGDVLELAEALDGDWLGYEDGGKEAAEAIRAAAEKAAADVEKAAGSAGTGSGDPPETGRDDEPAS